MAYTVKDHLKDAAAAKKKREDGVWKRKHKRTLEALKPIHQIHKELREKRERAEKREENRLKRSMRLSPANLRQSFLIVEDVVMLTDTAHDTALIFGDGYQISLFGKILWKKQLEQLLQA